MYRRTLTTELAAGGATHLPRPRPWQTPHYSKTAQLFPLVPQSQRVREPLGLETGLTARAQAVRALHQERHVPTGLDDPQLSILLSISLSPN